jgi:tRNA dimethylallyltransferase
MERRGFTIHWIEALQPMEDKVAEILKIVNSK